MRRHAVRVSPQFSNRMIEAARSVLNRYIPDIYIYADVYKGEESGKCVSSSSFRFPCLPPYRGDTLLYSCRSPGYALTLLSESTTSALHSAEAASPPTGGTTPEEVALKATYELLNEVRKGGCVDRSLQSLVLVGMCLGSEDVGRCRMGELSARS
jgi:RNA 3'-terminal phosphate cyclase-like protein